MDALHGCHDAWIQCMDAMHGCCDAWMPCMDTMHGCPDAWMPCMDMTRVRNPRMPRTEPTMHTHNAQYTDTTSLVQSQGSVAMGKRRLRISQLLQNPGTTNKKSPRGTFPPRAAAQIHEFQAFGSQRRFRVNQSKYLVTRETLCCLGASVNLG